MRAGAVAEMLGDEGIILENSTSLVEPYAVGLLTSAPTDEEENNPLRTARPPSATTTSPDRVVANTLVAVKRWGTEHSNAPGNSCAPWKAGLHPDRASTS